MPVRRVGLTLGLVVLLGLLPPAPTAAGPALPRPAAEEPLQPYKVTEFLIYRGPGFQTEPAIAGPWVLWRDHGPGPVGSSTPDVRLRNVETDAQADVPHPKNAALGVELAGDLVLVREVRPSPQAGLVSYSIPSGARAALLPEAAVGGGVRLRVAGNLVAWSAGAYPAPTIRVFDFSRRSEVALPEGIVGTNPDVSGTHVVWLDWRHRPPPPPFSSDAHIYAYDLRTGNTLRLSSLPEPVSEPAISGDTVVWTALRDGKRLLLAYDLARQQQRLLAESTQRDNQGLGRAAIDGDLVVWSDLGAHDHDIFGYDLKRDRSFVISRAAGDQTAPRISGRRVVWADNRHGNLAKYQADSDIYGALLEGEPASPPPAWGVPQAIDAKIEAVWPGGKQVAHAEQAVVDAWVFQPGTSAFAACMWSPRLRLWKAVDNEPARPAATAVRNGNYAVPTWSFHRVDVSQARDPGQKIYFFIGLEGVPTASNVWAHAAEGARTIFPVPDRPSGVAPAGESVDARIEIVWPHSGAPVERAERANITAMLFQPDSLVSVPPDWSPTVRLLRSLNDGVAREAAVGSKRIVREGSLTYPVWDFNDIGVLAATDPANTYYFRLSVDGVTTYSNVWAHGQDGRTYFPRRDTPTALCGR